MNNLFPAGDFDNWADSYDKSAYQGSSFPFEGYSDVLAAMVKLSSPQPGASVLDLGIGTGNLALLFAQRDCYIWGIDFSERMLALAQVKLPAAKLACIDLRMDWPPVFGRRYDHIVSAYTFHHFPLQEKVALISRLLRNHLQPGGSLVVGDLAFRNAAEEALLRNQLGEDWEQEYSWLANEAPDAFASIGITFSFFQESICAGVFNFKEE